MRSPIKIGYTGKDPFQRVRELQTGNPNALQLVGWIEEGRGFESWLHGIFRDDRMQGEWFKASHRLYGFIQGYLHDEGPELFRSAKFECARRCGVAGGCIGLDDIDLLVTLGEDTGMDFSRMPCPAV